MRILLTLLLLFTSTTCFAAPIKVAVFDGDGVGKSCANLISTLTEPENTDIKLTRITTQDILDGQLSEIDVLIHSGGSGSKQGNDLGEEGRKMIRQYIGQGGGFLGVCAGAYLATNDYTWSLNLIDAKVLDRKHWARGTGTVQLELSPSGKKLFQSKESTLDIYYQQSRAVTVAEGSGDIIVYIHGGYWQALDKKSSCWHAERFLQSDNCSAFVAIGYDLCPTVSFPTLVQQVKSGVAHVLRTFPKHRIHVVGHSAGGHLGAEVLLQVVPCIMD